MSQLIEDRRREDRHRIAHQIERINDEADGQQVSVIVQMKSEEEDEEFATLLAAASRGMRARMAYVSARDVLPSPAEVISQVKPTGKVQGTARKSAAAVDPGAKFAYLSPLAGSWQGALKSLRSGGAEALKPLLDDQFVKSITRGGSAAKSGPKHTPLWASSSTVLELSRDQLKQLPSKVSASDQIAEIYPNRLLSIPPVQKLDQLPAVIEDNKAGAWGLEKTGALAVWGAYRTRGRGVKVAVLDTGVDPSHPDLKDKIADFAEFEHDGTRKSDIGLEEARDSAEHGTHCAGTIVGGRKSGRWIGMAPDAKVLAGLVLDEGRGSDAQILGGMQWAIESGAQIISMSLGGLRLSPDVLDTYTRTIINANRLGVSVIIAIGNEGSQTSGSPGNDYFAFTVGATDVYDRAAGFSGGRTQVIAQSRYIEPEYLPLIYSKPDVSAPGVAIYSCLPGGGYAAWNGTSMATPHVAGAMALLLGVLRPDVVPINHRAYILQALLAGSVDELGEAGQNHRFGYGRINVLRAIGHAAAKNYLVDEIPEANDPDDGEAAPRARAKPRKGGGGGKRRKRR